MMQQEHTWKDIKEIWANSAKGAKINYQVLELIQELKGKMTQFEKDSIKSDIVKIKSSWAHEKKNVSQFEKDSINKGLKMITNLLKKLIDKFKPRD